MSWPAAILPWQQSAWSHLQAYLSQQRIPQALLLTGRDGLGKRHLAEQFAFSLLCHQPQPNAQACGQCPSCLLLKAGSHPDLLQVQPEEPGKAITIAQIRQLLGQLNLAPQYERYRAVLMNPAERLNNAAANAFLKCLEEPNERTVLILISSQPGKLLPTIRSRCQKLALVVPDRAVFSAWLSSRNIAQQHELLFQLAQGAPLLAEQYAGNGALKTRAECLKAWLSVAGQQSSPVSVAELWQNLPESALWFWLTSWVSDLIKCAYHAKIENLYNPDAYSALKELSSKLDLKQVYDLYQLLLASRPRLDTQVNKLNLFEEILIQWAELNRS